MTGPGIQVLLVDDEHLIRGAMAALLGLEDDMVVAGQAGTGAEAVAMARALRPDVAVVDLQLPDRDGIAVAEAIQRDVPTCHVMIVTSHGLPGHLKRALAAGVRGFLPKTAAAEVLPMVVRTVHSGGRYVDPQLAAEAISAGASPLTTREAEILGLAAEGAPIDDIARGVRLSPGTVRNYLSAAVGKLGAVNRHEAVRIARGRGWI
ncbi:DNA-binding response regulator [Actinoplanes sp. NPDC049265]|uniref:response regulator transcription factor n=1 Tax=Actinoplanes sp. NPDC049265 TaxID=3363902 RepID=UPI00371ADC8F